MAAHGFTKTDFGKSDFGIAYTVSMKDVSVVSKHRNFGFSHRFGRPMAWREMTRVDQLPEGTLVLDVIDPDLDRVVWSGRVSAILKEKQDRDARLRGAVDKLLDSFTPSR